MLAISENSFMINNFYCSTKGPIKFNAYIDGEYRWLDVVEIDNDRGTVKCKVRDKIKEFWLNNQEVINENI